MESTLSELSRKKASGDSRGPENLIEEEVAMRNYPLKSRNYTVQQENETHYQYKEV